MNDDLLKYYNRELSYIRRMGAEFAEQYPKVAGRLRISDETVEDPHVSRLIEGFSLLTAQIRQKLDDSFPEITDALLGQICPDYQAPIPSMAVIKITTQNLSTRGIRLARGSEFKTDVDGLKPCEFRSCYETDLWPVEVVCAHFENAPFKSPTPSNHGKVKSLVKLTLACEFDNTNFSVLGIDRLRFYINGQRHHVHVLHEMIHRNLVSIGIAPSGQTDQMKTLTSRHIRAVGYDDEHAVVPYGNRSVDGYRLLVEQFLFPEKFLFFDIADLDPAWPGVMDKLDVFLYFSEDSEELQQYVSADSFLLGCTPVINLFEQNLEPVRLAEQNYEYRLVPKYQNADTCEIVSLDDVSAITPHGNSIKLSPFYAQGHPVLSDQDQLFWHTRRGFAQWAGGHTEAGTELYMSVVDKRYNATAVHAQAKDWLLQAKARCCNRNLPASLPFGGGEPKLRSMVYVDSIKTVRCLTAPTTTVRPALHDNSRWQLVSHLSLNTFTGEGALARLKETLHLYDFCATPESKLLIDGIVSLVISPGTTRVNQKGKVAFCSGSDIVIEFSESSFTGSSFYLFASILDVFFCAVCSD